MVDMAPKTIQYYDWFEQIQPKLCELMGIEEEYFRNYHNLVGGEYKDFWHVYLDMYDIHGNDCYFKQWWICGEDVDYSEMDDFSGDNEWKMLLVKAIDSLHRDLGEESILIWISW